MTGKRPGLKEQLAHSKQEVDKLKAGEVSTACSPLSTVVSAGAHAHVLGLPALVTSAIGAEMSPKQLVQLGGRLCRFPFPHKACTTQHARLVQALVKAQLAGTKQLAAAHKQLKQQAEATFKQLQEAKAQLAVQTALSEDWKAAFEKAKMDVAELELRSPGANFGWVEVFAWPEKASSFLTP